MAERDSGQPDFAEPARSPTGHLGATSFIQRAVIRRRVRFLRRRRELALYDLGGFLFESHRLSEPREDLLDEKLVALSALDDELAVLQRALDLHEELAVLHEPGISACPQCGTLHDSAANFCPHCGLAVGGHAGFGPAPADYFPQIAVVEASPPADDPPAGETSQATARMTVVDLAAVDLAAPDDEPIPAATASMAALDLAAPDDQHAPAAAAEAPIADVEPSPPAEEPEDEPAAGGETTAPIAAAGTPSPTMPQAPGEHSPAAADAPP
jgi:hypothetical protein